MNASRTQKISVLAAAAIVLPALIGIAIGVDAAYYLMVAVVLLLAVVGYSLWQAPPTPPKIDPWADHEPRRVEPEPPRRPSPKDIPLDAALPSNGPDYRFRVTGTVSWRPVKVSTEHAEPDALARDVILERAGEITSRFSLTDRERAEHALGAQLGASEPDTGKEIDVWAHNLVLSVDDADDRRVRIIENVQKDREVFDYRRSAEVDIRSYLKDDALASQGSTLVWWLSRNLDEFEESVDRFDTFARVSAVAQGREDPVPHARPSAVSGLRMNGANPADTARSNPRALIEALLPDAGDDERGELAAKFARAAADLGHLATADSLRTAFGLQNLDDPAESPQSDQNGSSPATDARDPNTVATDDESVPDDGAPGTSSDEHPPP